MVEKPYELFTEMIDKDIPPDAISCIEIIQDFIILRDENKLRSYQIR